MAIGLHRLVARQLRKATAADGTVDVAALVAMVSEAYEESDQDRRRTDRSITLMIEEVERLSTVLSDDHSRRLAAAVDSMVHGFSMFDGEQRLVACNDKYLAMYHLPRELGSPGTTLTEIIAFRTEKGTMPLGHEEGFVQHIIDLNPEVDARRLVYRFADGRTIAVTQTAMADGGFVGVHQDITAEIASLEELENGRAQFARQNQRFEAAINNISHGLCMLDADERLVICNRLYATMYGLPPELVRPGTPLVDIVAHRVRHGTSPMEGPEAYLAVWRHRYAEGRPSADEVELADGRTISMRLHPIASGGWVTTHEDITEQKNIEARIRHLARHDALTNLPNRVLLREEMDRLDARIACGETVAVLCLDLDRFKAVNDTLGHAVGDGVLATVAGRLREAGRESDIVGRLGGDEFAVLLNGLDDAREAADLADRIVKSIAEPIRIDGHDILIGASVGIACAPLDGSDAEALLRNADMALYRAKNEGRGTFHFFEKGMDEALQHRRTLEQGLRTALARNEFHLLYQPLIDIETQRVCCFEALLRWEHPDLGPVSPLEFVAVAEETGIICPIGEWVLGQACRTAASWPGEVRVAVNLSPIQFRNRGLVDQVVRALAGNGLAPGRLEIEVTESLLLGDTDLTLQTLHQLRGLGIRIAMDDFGTGYSSLSYLRAFPFDKIKIDRSFIGGIAPGGDALTIVKAMVGLGQSLGMSTTAEGVETEEQLAAIRSLGCREAQGFLFSPPLPASGAEALLGAVWGREQRRLSAAG